MDNDAIYNKIAEGLYASAVENNTLATYKEDLKFIVWNLVINKEYFDFLKSPFIEEKNKFKSLDEIFSSVVVPEVLDFIKLVINKGLISGIEYIQKHFNELAAIKENIILGTVYSAIKLKKSQIVALEKTFGKKFNHTVELKNIIDESLIIGIRVLINGYVYEYSAESELEEIKNGLITNINKETNSKGEIKNG